MPVLYAVPGTVRRMAPDLPAAEVAAYRDLDTSLTLISAGIP